MYNVTKYQESVEKLASSVMIKLDAIGLTMNKKINSTYDVVNQFELERREWKYYKNLSGEYHEVDYINYPEGLFIKLIETRETVLLTKETLIEYSVTRNALINRDTIYTSLMLRYPNAHLLVRGIISPYNIDDLLECDDGTILSYNQFLIDKNEVSLIPALQTGLKDFVRRWVHDDYALIDELYIATKVLNIRNFIILRIHNHRLGRVMTGEVCEFHLTEYFRSNLGLDEHTVYLNKSQQFWLYKNLRYLITNTGTTEVLKKINENILKPVGITLKEYGVYIEDPTLLIDNIGKHDKPDIHISGDIMREVSSTYLKPVALDELLVEGLIVTGTYDNIYKDSIPQLAHNLVEKSKRPTVNEQSKYLSIGYDLDLSLKNTNLAEVTIENWIDLAYSYGVNYIISYVDSNTKLIYDITPKESILILLKYMLELVGKADTPISTVTLNNVLDRTAPPLEITIPSHEEMKSDYVKHISLIPEWENGVTSTEVGDYINDIVGWYRLYWLDSVNDQAATNSFIKGVMLDRIRKPKTVEISAVEKTIDELLNEKGIGIITTKHYDYNQAMIDLIRASTGVDIDVLKSKKALISAYRAIINKLTSYTLLMLKEDVVNTEALPAVETNIIRGLDASKIYAGRSACFEHSNHEVYIEADDDNDWLLDIPSSLIHIEKVTKMTKPKVIFVQTRDTPTIGDGTQLVCEPCLEREL